jgi:hypothetical protein
MTLLIIKKVKMLVDEIIYGITKIETQKVISHNFIRSDYQEKQWLAEIKGPCKTYGFERSFVNSKKVKAHNFLLARFEYLIEPHKIYQYKGFLIDAESKLFYEGFFATTMTGVIELEYEQIRSLMNMPVKSWHEFGKRKQVDSVVNYTADNIPF